MNDTDSYNMIDNNYFDLNKTFDLIYQAQTGNKPKVEPQSYGNILIDKPIVKKEPNYKQKPAAPEINRKVINPISNINSCPSDSSMIQYSNASSTKSFNRPKSMERLKRKQSKRKTAKSKPRKKTKKKSRNNEFTTFDHSGSLNISQTSGNVYRALVNDKNLKDISKVKPSEFHDYRRAKLDQEINKLCKIKPTVKAKESRNAKQSRLLNTNTYSIPRKPSKGKDNIFDKKMTSMKTKHKPIKGTGKLESELIELITNR